MNIHVEPKIRSRILDHASVGDRLSADEIFALYDLPADEVVRAAHEARLRASDPEIATYSIGGNIDYTTICTVACRFCAFYRARHQEGAYTLTFDEIAQQMDEIVRVGGLDVLIQGGVNPDLPFSWYLDLMKMLKADYPGVHVDALSPEEILGLEKLTGRTAYDLLAELKDAGLDGIPGAASEILVDEVRVNAAPTRIMTGDWFRIVDAAQSLHLHIPWVGMVTGFGETLRQRVEHLLALRQQQDRAMKRYGSGFIAFKVWPARLENTRLNGMVAQKSDDEIVEEYLRNIAISRIALDNITNHRSVWRTMGFRVAAEALRSGANDLCGTGSINAINATMVAAGKHLPDPNRTLLAQVRQCIEDAGFVAALRDPHYKVLARHDGDTELQLRQ